MKIQLKKLRLENFKSFEQAELMLGPLTVLLGANATGKSNIREAFRFLHGVGLGYSLADIFGEKSVGGEKVWDGIRGGTQEAAFTGHSQFQIGLEINYYQEEELNPIPLTYQVQIQLLGNGHPPRIASESLTRNRQLIFKATAAALPAMLTGHIPVELYGNQDIMAELGQPILNQIGRKLKLSEPLPLQQQQIIDALRDYLAEMRFVELSPAKMRVPSFPGQSLGDQGENLSSALKTIYDDPQLKAVLMSWVEELTPMDLIDLDFPTDQIGRILVSLIETNRRTSAYSASDGTLRFLGLLAALLNPEPATFYYFEELENGVHPTRIYLISQLLERQAEETGVQVVVNTHSPYLLNFLSRHALNHAALLYRPEKEASCSIHPIAQIPDAQRLMDEQGILRLYESGWFEDALFFANGQEIERETAG